MTDWIELPRLLCEPGPTYVRATCRHGAGDVVSVESVTGEVVAQLCTRCDMALHADWVPPPDSPPITPDLDLIEETYR